MFLFEFSGFSVDFTAHICYAYMSSTAKHPDDKVKEALYALGLPIFQGSVSTVLGMLALLLANNYIFSVFFKMVFLVVFFGAMHGLFLLPVLLSLFGPGSCTRVKKNENAVRMSSIEKSLPHPYCIPHPQFTLNGSNLGGALKGATTLPGVERYSKKPFKPYPETDKDLGLGTSEENSSESSIHSQKKQAMDDTALEKRYREAWQRESESTLNQFRASQVLDLFGNDTEAEYYKQKHRYNETRNPRMYGPRKDEEPIRARYEPKRRYSPPDSRYHPRQNQMHLVRSNSYHDVLHHRYYK